MSTNNPQTREINSAKLPIIGIFCENYRKLAIFERAELNLERFICSPLATIPVETNI
jgi:hypothetical protein